MKVSEIRESFLQYFEEHGHYRHDSYPLVPINDESLLLIGAGMAPLKNYFLGLETPPSKRMVTCQKCIRTGDIDNVGRTARHATFFEMLGNFSFGDYFKEEAIALAWDYITNHLKIDKEDLWITVFEEDDEALEIWAQQQQVPRERIVKLGREDNFWEIGNGTGPSGPCSEIYIDRGDRFNCDNPHCQPGCECDRFLEFWNLVFTQYDKDLDGNYNLLENPNIDTGMGLERIACIMQDVDSIFDIDTMIAIRDEISKISGKAYGQNEKTDVSIRIIADHTKAVTFLLSDGVIPSNEGRGYILRRLLRRAARHGKLLGIKGSFLVKIVEVVIAEYASAYPDLLTKQDYIEKLVTIEERKFQETIDQGLNILDTQIEKLNKEGLDTLPGEEAFKLYDTFGFPVEITEEILEENNKKLDMEKFDQLMNIQKETARKARYSEEGEGWTKSEEALVPTGLKSEFVGYEKLEVTSKINLIIKNGALADGLLEGDKASIVLEKTPFYGEGGGQVGDTGIIKGPNFEALVKDTKKTGNSVSIHNIEVTKGQVSLGEEVTAAVELGRRKDIMKNHSATHLLHKALKKVLGNHVSQAGSYVDDKRLRFDFSHFEAMTAEELSQVENLVNQEIFDELDIKVRHMPIKEAKQLGAEAQFDEKYGDEVRVISMGDFSTELCGGTHVNNTSQIMSFKILSETSVASGIRRIEAATGRNVLNYLYEKELKISNITDILKSNSNNVEQRAEQIVSELRASKKEIEQLKGEAAMQVALQAMENAVEFKGLKVIVNRFENTSMESLKEMAQKVIDKYDNAVVLFGGTKDDKINYVSACGKEAIVRKAHAGNIVKQVAQISGGSGGGKPSFAQAGGKDLSKFDDSIKQAIEIIKSIID